MRSRGEFSFIDRLKRQAEKSNHRFAHGLAVGIGDDAAVWRNIADHDSVISADMLVEDVDFRLDWSTPADIGHKALAVSLSDIAAMGARPAWALVSLGVTKEIWSNRFLDKFFEGFFALAEKHQVTLIGGDVSRTPDRVVIDSTVIGQAWRKRTVLRVGAQVGDAVFVTGCLGGAAGGLRLMQRGKRPSSRRKKTTVVNPAEALMLRQARPEPRAAWGALLGEKQLASAMIDISDGLSSDLHHLCRASAVGARIELSSVPCDSLLAQAGFSSDEATECALHGGEDFELLFTVPQSRVARLPSEVAGVPVTRIGTISDRQSEIKIHDGRRWKAFKPGGFTHF